MMPVNTHWYPREAGRRRACSRLHAAMLAGVAAGVLGGCESLPFFGEGSPPSREASVREEAPPADAATAEAEAYARRIEAGLAALERGEAPAASGGDVLWLDESRDAGGPESEADATTPSVRVLREAAKVRSELAAPEPAADSTAQDEPLVRAVIEPARPAPMGRRELIAALAAVIADEGGSAADRALRAAALALVDADGQVNEAALARLDDETARTARRYAQLIRVLAGELEAGGSLDRDALIRRLAEIYGPAELRIRRFELCQRVQSYGVFDPIESRVLLVGKPHRLGLYLELENFASAEISSWQFEVKLRQEVELFNAADGLAVWRQSPVPIVDRSRNQRRDFFTWQVVELPARLSVGRYILKVRVTDLHAQMISEDAIELQVVADPKLAQAGEAK